MIDKIHFSLNVSIYLVNMLLCILFYKIKSINLKESNLTKEFIFQMENVNPMALAYSLFMLIYSLVFIVIYQEIYGNDILKDIFINIFYLSFISTMLYHNYKIVGIIKNEENNYSLKILDIPNDLLDNLIYIYHYIQGLFLLLILLTILKGFITFYRGTKNFIINYFQQGGNILYFEMSHIIS